MVETWSKVAITYYLTLSSKSWELASSIFLSSSIAWMTWISVSLKLVTVSALYWGPDRKILSAHLLKEWGHPSVEVYLWSFYFLRMARQIAWCKKECLLRVSYNRIPEFMNCYNMSWYCFTRSVSKSAVFTAEVCHEHFKQPLEGLEAS